ncbi:MAG: HEAT repeat domain-containing protein [Pontiella sp.]
MIKQTIFTALVGLAISTPAKTTNPTNTPSSSEIGITIQEMLITGSTQLKMHSLAMISQGSVKDSVDETYLPGLTICAKDKESLLRSTSARILGQHFLEGKDTPHPEAIDLLMKLAKDESSDVRFSAIYYGLTEITYKSPELAEQLLDIASKERSEDLYEKIVISLSTYKPQVTELLDEKLAEGDNIAIYEIYEDFTGGKPKGADKYLNMPSSRPHLLIINGKGEGSSAIKENLEKELKAGGIENPNVQISGKDNNSVLMLTTYITRDYMTAKKLLSNHDTFSITQEMWLTPELEIQIEAMRKASQE